MSSRLLVGILAAVTLLAIGVGAGALIWAGNDKPEPTTAAETAPATVTMGLSAKVWHCIADARRYGLTVTSTTGGRHAPGSYHYSARAADTAGPYANMLRMQHHLYSTRKRWLEVIGPRDNWGVKNGQPFRYSPALLAQHDNHVHCAG